MGLIAGDFSMNQKHSYNIHDLFVQKKRVFTLITASFVVLAIIFLSGSFQANAESADDLQSQLDAINAKIKSYNGLVTQTQQQRTNLSNEIKSLEASAAALEQKINANQTQVQNLSGEINEIENQIDEKERIVNSQRSLLKELMRSYYENTDRAQFQLLLSTQESANLLNEGDWTFETGHKIQEMLGSIRAIKKSLAIQYDSLRQKKSEADQLAVQLEQRSGYLESTKQSKEYLVMRTQQQEKKYNNIIDDLEEKRHEIEDELNQLDAAKVDQLDLSKLPAFRKSTLYYPVASPHRSQGYGKATWTKWYTFHNGIDFSDKVGTPIIAAADGKVLATGNNGRYAYGKWIAIDHGNGLVTLYGHLSSQKASKGESVKRGEVIGLMGSTGYSTGSHVHFTVFAKNSFDIVPSTKVGGLMLPTGAHVNPSKYLP